MKHKCLVIIILFLAIILLFGCTYNKKIDLHVSTFAQLKEAKYNNNVILDADIDCEYETIKPLVINSIDGNNHTIKNAVIKKPSDMYESSSLFNWELKSIKNIVLDNIELTASLHGSCAIVLEYGDCTIENVTVRNSKIIQTAAKKDTTFTGIIYGGLRTMNYNVPDPKEYLKSAALINHCSVINCSIELNDSNPYFVGGIAGYSEKITNCKVDGFSFTNVYKDTAGKISVGGIAGAAKSIMNCVVRNSEFNIDASYHATGLYPYSNTVTYCGGIVGNGDFQYGDPVSLSYVQSENNVFNIRSATSCCVGGIIGKLTSSLSEGVSIGNKYNLSDTMTNSTNSFDRFVGGICGRSSGSIFGVFSYDNVFSDDILETNKKANIGFAGICGYNQSTISYGLSCRNTFEIKADYDSVCMNQFDIIDVYTDDMNHNKTNALSVDELNSLTLELMKTKFGLSSDKWTIKNGNLVLDF